MKIFNDFKNKIKKKKEKREEKERIEKERLEKERLEKERLEKERAKREKIYIIAGVTFIVIFLFAGIMISEENDEKNELLKVEKEIEKIGSEKLIEEEKEKETEKIEKEKIRAKEAREIIDNQDKEEIAEEAEKKEKINIKKLMVRNIISEFNLMDKEIIEDENESSLKVDVLNDDNINVLNVIVEESLEVEGNNVISVKRDHNKTFLGNAGPEIMEGATVKVSRALLDYHDKIEGLSVTHMMLLEDIYGNQTSIQGLEVYLSKETIEKINWDNFYGSDVEAVADTYILNEELKE